MTASLQPNEFRYHDDRAFKAAVRLLAVASVLLVSSVVTGVWGVSALVHASWLDANDLPVTGVDTWGIGMLILASLQGITALLIIFDRRLGIYLGITVAAFSILVNIAMLTAFPIGSLISISVTLVVIAVLYAYRPRH
jgi:hypothetical protein